MKHRQWFFLALSPLLLVVALVGVRSFGGPGVAEAQAPKLEIDLVEDTGWCDTIDDDADRTDVSEYEVAICLTDSPAAPAGFEFQVVYDEALNTCTNVTTIPGASLDDNPDANAGTTVWPDVANSLGTGWDCSDSDLSEPRCDLGGSMGTAYMSCMSPAGTLTLPFGAGVSAPLAVLKLRAAADGDDNLTIQNAAVFDANVVNILSCTTPSAACVGATEHKSVGEEPASTATPTATPTPTSTPWCGGERQTPCPTSTVTPRAWTKTPTPAPTGTPAPSEPGEPAQPPPPPPPPPGGTMPQVVPPATGTGSGGVDWTTSLMWTLAGAGALSVFLGGLYLRRARNR